MALFSSFRKRFQYQVQTTSLEPIIPSVPTPVGMVSNNVSFVSFVKRFIYQAIAITPFVPESITPDKWTYPWSEPLRPKIAAGLAIALVASGPVIPPPQPPNAAVMTASSPVIYESQFQFQATAQVIFQPAEIITPDKWIYPWSEPVHTKLGVRRLHLQASFFAPSFGLVNAAITTASSPVSYESQFQFQSTAQPVFTPSAETITPDKWIYPWSEPVRQKKGLRAGLQQSLAATTLEPNTQIIQTYESRWHYAWSEPVRLRRFPASEQQALAFQPPIFEVITPDKWAYPWSEPVRQKIGLGVQHQKSLFAPELLTTGNAITSAISSQVTYKQRFIYQSTAETYVVVIPVTDQFGWYYGWSEPVRQKVGLGAHLQQALIAPVLEPNTQITQTYESRWHYAWSEPVRFRILHSAYQQFFTFQPPSFEIITPDKWAYPWSEPVRQKPGLKVNLQQAFIGLTLNPETQIIQGYESRWHYAWSEPVRVKQQLSTGDQRAQFEGPIQTPEFVTVDKWIYGWSEPVRQKPGLRASLQQALIAPVLNPNTQITQDFESRWHYPWSEPVRFRSYPTAQQPSFTTDPRTPETVTADKWVYRWSEPVRSKAGLRADLQQALIQTVLNPETQITQNYESRWHQGWSEPVRTRQFATAEQQFIASAISIAETVTLDKWAYPWSEPTRFRQFPVPEQQAAITPALNFAHVDVVTASSPVSFKRRFIYQSVAQPVPIILESIGPDKWGYAWYEPVRQKIGLAKHLQQNLITPAALNFVTANVAVLSSQVTFKGRFIYQGISQPVPIVPEALTIDKWNYPWSEPVRLKVGLGKHLQQTIIAPASSAFLLGGTTAISSPVIFPSQFQYQEQTQSEYPPPITADRWLYGWSEPVRLKIGLPAQLQQFITPQTPVFPNLTTLIQWFAALNEPVRLKIGMSAWRQPFFTTSPYPFPNDILITLSATETNADSASFTISTYNTFAEVKISIEEIQNLAGARVSIKEIKFIDSAVASIEET